ncbi:hypothetical protein TNCT_382371 [Trichonephila clavata]|uniref:Uncharacterized protein n=1 Tax=Trichonephila clavata TaxID=2740835 RepID=A0A8X6K969_TRICU|nr:hypothetical protein TNCT_382371 [Trichonephila clavata]
MNVLLEMTNEIGIVSLFRSSSSTCIDRDSREKYHPESQGKKKAGIGKFFRHLGSAKTSPRHGPKPGLPKSNSQAERSEIDDAPILGNEPEEEEQMKIVKMVQESYISTRPQPSQSVSVKSFGSLDWGKNIFCGKSGWSHGN